MSPLTTHAQQVDRLRIALCHARDYIERVDYIKADHSVVGDSVVGDPAEKVHAQHADWEKLLKEIKEALE
jgi:hypothetical protein